MKYLNIVIVAVLLLSSVALAFPKPVGFVNDFANILPDKAQFEEGLRLYERNTTIEVVVVTIDALPEDQTAATYAVELFQDWGIGKKGEDNGILILIIKNGTTGNRMRIELGYGIQGYVTGAEASRILDEALPFYTAGDYQTALDTILLGLSDQLESYKPGGKSFADVDISSIVASLFPLIIVMLFILSAVIHSNKCPDCKSRNIKCIGDFCVCQKCGKKFKRKRSATPIIIAGGFGSGGGGFGGLGGGASGGGGAGR